MAGLTGADHAGKVEIQTQILPGMLFQMFLDQGEEREKVEGNSQGLVRNRKRDDSRLILQYDEWAFPFLNMVPYCLGQSGIRSHEQAGAHDEKIRGGLPKKLLELYRARRYEDAIAPMAQDDLKGRQELLAVVADQQAFHGRVLAVELERM
jgi:hypothetical protein